MVLARFACEEHPAARRSVLEKQGPRPKHGPGGELTLQTAGYAIGLRSSIFDLRSSILDLGKNDYLSFHAQDVVQGADIWINTRLVERDPEASYSRRRLGKSDALLGSSLDETRVHTVGGGIKHGMTLAVGVNGYVWGWRKRVLRFSTEGDGVWCDRIVIGPFKCFARVDRQLRLLEAHDRGSLGSTPRGNYLAAANGHAVF